MVTRPIQHPCEACPLDRRDNFKSHSAEEVESLKQLKRSERAVASGEDVLTEGQTSAQLYTVLSGWGFRYKMLADGRRQILNYVMPGDFIGLQATLFGEMQHSVVASASMVLCVFERISLAAFYERSASLAYNITWQAAREEQILEEHLLSVGRRSALERAAYLISFVHQRAKRTGAIVGGDPLVPFTQSQVADTLGLSLVHTNKTLRKLQQARLIRWSGKSCYVLDPDGLRAEAQWDGLEKIDRPFV